MTQYRFNPFTGNLDNIGLDMPPWKDILTNEPNLAPGKYIVSITTPISVTLSLDTTIGDSWWFSDPKNLIAAPNFITINDNTTQFTNNSGVFQNGPFTIDVTRSTFIIVKLSTNQFGVINLTGGTSGGDFVTLSTNQTITGLKTFTSDINGYNGFKINVDNRGYLQKTGSNHYLQLLTTGDSVITFPAGTRTLPALSNTQTFTGTNTFSNNIVITQATPTLSTHATRKDYVDGLYNITTTITANSAIDDTFNKRTIIVDTSGLVELTFATTSVNFEAFIVNIGTGNTKLIGVNSADGDLLHTQYATAFVKRITSGLIIASGNLI